MRDRVVASRYRINDLTLDVSQRRVLRGSERVPLSKLSFELLRVLAEAALARNMTGAVAAIP